MSSDKDEVNRDHPVKIERRFEATTEQVFRFWSEPQLFGKWSWGSLGRNVEATADFRVGGVFRVETESKNGDRWSFTGTYLEIEPDCRIVHTLEWQAPVGYDPVPERVEVTLTAKGNGTVVEFVHIGVPDAESAKGHLEGWQNTMETLGILLADRHSN
jgi:uncharacterized protein YndB with AHSA1/START domain